MFNIVKYGLDIITIIMALCIYVHSYMYLLFNTPAGPNELLGSSDPSLCSAAYTLLCAITHLRHRRRCRVRAT